TEPNNTPFCRRRLATHSPVCNNDFSMIHYLPPAVGRLACQTSWRFSLGCAQGKLSQESEMKLYGINLSNFMTKSRIVVYEKGANVEIVGPPGGTKSPEYLKINPLGKIPTLD